jgi:hypothetical protein
MSDDNQTRNDRGDWYRPPSGIPASGKPAGNMTFEPGNDAAVSHGAYSERVYSPIAKELRDWALAEFPDLAVERYLPEVDAWAFAEAQAQLMRKVITAKGAVDQHDDFAPRTSYINALRAFEADAARRRAALGMNPRSHAALVKDRAEASALTVDLGALLARGAAALEARGDREHDDHVDEIDTNDQEV